MRIVFLGTGQFAVPALRALVRAGHVVTAVISQPDRPAGRGLRVRSTPVHTAADELGLQHIQAQNVNCLDWQDAFGAEIGVVVAFGQKIAPAVLQALPRGCVNVHASLLPKYRGAAPIAWAIINGEAQTGVTIFQLDERWDAGPIWSRREVAIRETETADELHDRLATVGAELLVETLPLIGGGQLTPVRQDDLQATFAPRLSRKDGVIDWWEPARRIADRIRGLWSWPGVAARLVQSSGRQWQVRLARAEVADAEGLPAPDRPPGTFAADGTVQAGRGRVRLLEVQPAGGRVMSFTEFARGRQIRPGDRLCVDLPT
jgi:methionyl-tRNA formyltransferase